MIIKNKCKNVLDTNLSKLETISDVTSSFDIYPLSGFFPSQPTINTKDNSKTRIYNFFKNMFLTFAPHYTN